VLAEVEAARNGCAVTYAAGDDPVKELRRLSPTEEQLASSEKAAKQARMKRDAQAKKRASEASVVGTDRT